MPATYSKDYINLVREKYNTHGGADITLFIGGVEIGTASSIQVSTERDKRPVYTFGSPSALAIGRGVRQISGVLENVSVKYSVIQTLMTDSTTGLAKDPQHWIAKKVIDNQWMQNGKKNAYDYYAKYTKDTKVGTIYDGPDNAPIHVDGVTPVHLDELLPIDIVVIGVNEFGSIAKMEILGAEFVSNAWAMSIQSVASVEQITFIARSFIPWQVITVEQGVTIQPPASPAIERV